MAYPPCNSVFYQLYPTPETIDIKKRYQINPLLSGEELDAILQSFVIDDKDLTVTHRPCANRPEAEQIRFADVVRNTLTAANDLPTARLWLRRIPAGIKIKFVDEEKDVHGMANRGGIELYPSIVARSPIEIVETFIHELAHVIDSQHLSCLTIFPYVPVHQSDTGNVVYDDSLTEAEFMRLFLIEEAEKNAISKQLLYESNSIYQSFTHMEKTDCYFRQYLKMYENWMPPKESGTWTDDEIRAERSLRAYFYASITAITHYMREFLQPYTQLMLQLPDSVARCVHQTSVGPIIDFKRINKLKLTETDLKKTTDIADKMQINLQYRQYAYTSLLKRIAVEWMYNNNQDFDNPQVQEILQTQIWPDPNERLKLIPEKETDVFNNYCELISNRYMGYITPADLKVKNTTDAVYLYLDKKDATKSMIDIETSFGIVNGLITKMTEQAQKYLLPYCLSRPQKKSKLSQQKVRE